MKFTAQIKEVKRLSTVSNDTEFSVKFITNENLAELLSIGADELVNVEVEVDTR
jgi:hypothetical protein